MNKTFSLDQIAKNSDLIADLLMRQYLLDKMAEHLEIKSINPRLKQSGRVGELKVSSSTFQRYRKKSILSPHRIPCSNTKTRKPKTSNQTEHDLKMTSDDHKMTSNENDKPVSKKNERI